MSSHKIGAVLTVQAVTTWMSLILLNLSLLTIGSKSFTKLVIPFTNFIIRPKNRIHRPVVLTAMGKPLFKAPDGGYYEIVKVTEDSSKSEPQQGPETSVLVDQKVRPEAFPSGRSMSVWSKIYVTSGFIYLLSLPRMITQRKEEVEMPFYKWSDLQKDKITPEYSSAYGPNIRGEKIEVGLFSYPAGTQAKPHAHPNEQIMVILKGKGKWRIGKEEKVLGPGEAVLIPANVEHELEIFDDLELINCKDVVSGWSVKNARWEK